MIHKATYTVGETTKTLLFEQYPDRFKLVEVVPNIWKTIGSYLIALATILAASHLIQFPAHYIYGVLGAWTGMVLVTVLDHAHRSKEYHIHDFSLSPFVAQRQKKNDPVQ